MGEKFAANPVTGTGSMTVPIPTSPGRSGFGLELSLSYDSGAGNGPFGFGWSLSLPSITRKTDKGLPKYDDFGESDVFVISGAEDLVPVLSVDAHGAWARQVLPLRTVDGATYRIDRYRPRTEGLFASIERWTNTGDPTEVFWRSISKDNTTTWYGRSADSRIADPADRSRIFSWLICQSHDDKGNVIVFRYAAEDSSGAALAKTHERNRTDECRSAQRYLKRVRYGNRAPYHPELRADAGWPEPPASSAIDAANAWHFEVVFDYGEHDVDTPGPRGVGTWPARPDPFSTYRAGFEIRTYRTCQRVLMFHHFPGEAGVDGDCLVRSTDFSYSDEVDPNDLRNPVYTFLRAVTQTAYRRNNGGYDRRSLPPLEFEYSVPEVQEVVEEVDPQSLENLPSGLDGDAYRWVDLHGEGTPGILTEQAGAWFYKRNLGPLRNVARFAAHETVALKPNVSLGAGAEIMDLAGDGQPDVVIMGGANPGLFEHDEGDGWQLFRPFTSRLNRDLRDPNLKLIDLDGDGHADLLISEDDALTWHASLAEGGFGPARRVLQALDEEKGPRVVFSDGTQSIYMADLSGDGLTDIVRIRNGEVCYWPNLGYCRFGAKVAMDNAPWFDHPDQFDHERVRLADIDGSGTADIIYLHSDGVRLYFNQSGNGWSQPQMLRAFPRVDDVVSIMPIDLLGDGTASLVWSSPLPGDACRTMRYVSLMGGQKPHLLVKITNNLGVETRVDYAPSTRFYLQDKLAQTPWVTRLPFPVHVVERVETYDHVSRNRFVTRYAYHHGHFDGHEREFRGFGMVEQWDTEQLGALAGGAVPGDNLGAASHVPPVHTKTWFHTGLYVGGERASSHMAGLLGTSVGEYYREPGLSDAQARTLLLEDTIIPPGLTLDEEREACRALKGSMLRQEVYADDAQRPGATQDQIERARRPYTVTEQNFTVRPIQPRGANRHAVFFIHGCEALTYDYERSPVDPRVKHALTLEVDEFGNVLKQAAVGYGRRASPLLQQWDRDRQTTPLITYTENSVTNPIGLPDTRRNPLPAEQVTFELTGYAATGPAGRYRATDLVEADPAAPDRLRHRFAAPEVPYEAQAVGNLRRRPIERVRTLYRSDDMSRLLPLGEVQSLALSGESYRLAFTPGLLAQVFLRPRQGQAAEPLLPDPALVLSGRAGDRGGYSSTQALEVDGRFPAGALDDHWWVPSGQAFFSPDPADDAAAESAQARLHFYRARRYRDAFGQDTIVDFDAYDLLMLETRDALGNRVRVDANDYRVLQPQRVSDANRNRTEVAFDTLGRVVATAVRGKSLPAPVEGDSLAGLVTDLTSAELADCFDAPDPRATAAALLQDATTRFVYDLDRFRRTQQANPNDPTRWLPACAATLARETHASSPLPPQGLKIQIGYSYSDGFGREIQKKVLAEAGRVPQRDPAGRIVVGGDGQPLLGQNDVSPRWVGSGWTVFNNKGKPVRQFEPFFTDTQAFEFDVRVGVSRVLFYDPAERVIATLYPNQTYEKVVFDAWRRTTYDVNDTCAPRNAETGDPRTDPDIAGYVFEYLEAQPGVWQTWHAQRIGAGLGLVEQSAAQRAAAHADTPSTAHFDALGRPFLTQSRNRVVCPGHDLDGTEEGFSTRVELDIAGNQRFVRDPVEQAGDPLGRVVVRYAYDMVGSRIHQLSMEAGARWMLSDVAGKALRAWDGRGHDFASTYDVLRRPVGHTVRGTSGESDPRVFGRELLVEEIEYGEALPNAEALNLRTRIYRHFDSAGLATNARIDAAGSPTEAYDFKGNLLHSTRRLVSDYTAVPDWQLNPALDDEVFEGTTRYDALNRPVQSIAPHSSRGGALLDVIQPTFNDANLLERVDVWLERAREPNGLLDPANDAASPVGVANIDYDAKGQRQRIDYKNGTSTSYGYDPLTSRLTQLQTRRASAGFPGDDPQPPVAGWPGTQVQNLHYTYDPVGNVIHVRDDAQQTIYFRNRRVEPSGDYVYDALYRLLQAHGREHEGQGGVPIPHSHDDAGRVGLPQPGDGNAMGTYIERYVYDAVGNFLEMQHRGSGPANAGWTRAYDYLEASLIEDGSGAALLKNSNRLTRTTLNPAGIAPQVEAYLHDAHGNVLRMSHLGGGAPGTNMHWDFKDRLRRTDLGGGGAAFHAYDAAGRRVRKVWQKAPGLIEERIYLGTFELFRKHRGPIGANTATLERVTLHVMDDKQRIALVETRVLDRAGEDLAPRRLIRYQFSNHLGSASLELDEQARIISYEEYAPYGSTTYRATRSRTETAKRYRYTGKERDEESGLYYHGARYLAPWMGRWCSADPNGPTGSLNLYQYAALNPTRLVDPDGRDEQPSWLESVRRQAVLGAVLGVRRGLATVNPLNPNGALDVSKDEIRAQQLLAQGDYERAFEVSTGFQEYFEIHHEGASNGASGGEQAAVMLGHATGFNQAVATYKGETRQGTELKGVDRVMTGVDATARLVSTGLTVAGGVSAVKAQVKLGLPFSSSRAMNIEVARYERLQGMVDVLTQEHPNLSAKNAWRIVDDLAPPKSTPRVAGGQGDGGADVQYVDASGTVVARVEVKAGIENANRFSEHLSYAAQNQAPGGLVVVQVPQGADVGNWLGRFWGRRQNLVQSTAPADVAKMNFYKTTDVTILDSSGKVLLPRQPIYNPPKP